VPSPELGPPAVSRVLPQSLTEAAGNPQASICRPHVHTYLPRMLDFFLGGASYTHIQVGDTDVT
jgi:hypothetical protein